MIVIFSFVDIVRDKTRKKKKSKKQEDVSDSHFISLFFNVELKADISSLFIMFKWMNVIHYIRVDW